MSASALYAEEMDRLERSLELFRKKFIAVASAKDWPYFGLVVQAYSKNVRCTVLPPALLD